MLFALGILIAGIDGSTSCTFSEFIEHVEQSVSMLIAPNTKIIDGFSSGQQERHNVLIQEKKLLLHFRPVCFPKDKYLFAF
jgi:hypothetical protein